jgi:hypothetical protein
MFLLQSSSTCWAIAVNDYGTIVSTTLALATFAALLFLVYVLRRTLASRTPESRRAQRQSAEKHKRKKRRQHTRGHKGMERVAGRSSAPCLEYDDKADKTDVSDGIDISLDSISAPEHSVANSAETQNEFAAPTGIPDETPTDVTLPFENIPSVPAYDVLPSTVPGSYDDHLSCGSASSRSTPVPSIANELPDSAVDRVVVLDKRTNFPTSAGHAKAKTTTSTGAQSKPSNSRRSQNRKNKRLNAASDTFPQQNAQPNPLPTPSKRWDALKPPSKPNNNRQRNTPPGKARGGREEQPRFDSATNLPSQFVPLQRPVKQAVITPAMDQQLPMHHTASFYAPPTRANQPAYPPVDSSTFLPRTESLQGGIYSGSPSLFENGRDTLLEAPTGFFSTLNPNSPSWSGNGTVNNTSSFGTTTLRPPPGLEMTFQNDIPFGCGSDGGSSPCPGSPFQHPPSMLDLYYPPDKTFGDSAPSSPFYSAASSVGHPEPDLLFLRDYQSLSMPANSDASLSFRLNTNDIVSSSPMVHSMGGHHVRENPFALSSDEEADVDQIEAELQVLGGQMVGSILDF